MQLIDIPRNLLKNIALYSKQRGKNSAKQIGNQEISLSDSTLRHNSMKDRGNAIRTFESLLQKSGIEMYRSVQNFKSISIEPGVQKVQTIDEVKTELTNLLNSMEIDPDANFSHMAVKISNETFLQLANDPKRKEEIFTHIKFLFCAPVGEKVIPSCMVYDVDHGEYGTSWTTGDNVFMLSDEALEEYENKIKGCFWRRDPVKCDLKVDIKSILAKKIGNDHSEHKMALEAKYSNINLNRVILGNYDYLRTDPSTGRLLRVINVGLPEEINFESIFHSPLVKTN